MRHSIRNRLVPALLVSVGWLVPAQGDILHLRDGSRHYGELVSENPREVAFRIVAAGGASSVRRFPAEIVARIERTQESAPPTEQVARAATQTLTPEDFDQILRESYELLDDGDQGAALRALQRLVTLAPEEVLLELDLACRAARDHSIGELLASARLDAALADVRRGAVFKLRGVTRFERDALGALLEARAAELLARVYTHHTIQEWAAGVASYSELQSDSRALVDDVRLAAALVAARIRYDPALYGAAAERKKLSSLRADLTRFAAGVMSLRGYTAAAAATAEESVNEWFRGRAGRGGTLLRRVPGEPTSQPAASRPAGPDEPPRDPAAEQPAREAEPDRPRRAAEEAARPRAPRAGDAPNPPLFPEEDEP